MAELSTGYPLFPGESEAEQLLCIMEVKGLPPPEILIQSTRRSLFFDGSRPKVVANSRGKKRYPGTRNLDEKLRSTDELFLDLIESNFYLETLDWNPISRITPKEALKHPWFNEHPSRIKNGSWSKITSK